MHSPVAPDELVAAIKAEVTAGAAWVKIIGDAPEWCTDGPLPDSAAATYDLDTLRQVVDAAYAAGARVAVHSNLPDSGLAAIGADSIGHGKALSHSEIEALGARGRSRSDCRAGNQRGRLAYARLPRHPSDGRHRDLRR
jgi:imidazolonepropionase-like amidohydrolase